MSCFLRRDIILSGEIIVLRNTNSVVIAISYPKKSIGIMLICREFIQSECHFFVYLYPHSEAIAFSKKVLCRGIVPCSGVGQVGNSRLIGLFVIGSRTFFVRIRFFSTHIVGSGSRMIL